MKVPSMRPVALSLARSGAIPNANLKGHGKELLEKIFELVLGDQPSERTEKSNSRELAAQIGSAYIEQVIDSNGNDAGVVLKTLKDLTNHENHAYTMAAVMWASLLDFDADPDIDQFMALFKNVETKEIVADAKACIRMLDCEGTSENLLNRTNEDTHQRLPKLTKALVEFFMEAANR